MATPDLNRIQAARERAMLRAFNAAIGDIKDSATISAIEDAISSGDTERVIALLGLDKDAPWSGMAESIRESYLIGGRTGAEQIGTIPLAEAAGAAGGGATSRRPLNRRTGTGGSGGGGGGGRPFRFNMPRGGQPEQMMGDFIVQISEEQRELVRERLSAALAEGRGPRSSALDLVGRVNRVTQRRAGGFIGLTRQQAQWSVDARMELENLNSNYFSRELRDKRFDGVIRRAIDNGNPIDQTTIDRAVTRMQARTLRYRGENIARTESLQALSEGQYGAIQQAMEAGELEQQFVTKRWSATGDARTRSSHAQVEASYPEGIPINQAFWVGGEMMQRPRQIGASASNVVNCRCHLVTRMSWAGQAAKEIKGFG